MSTEWHNAGETDVSVAGEIVVRVCGETDFQLGESILAKRRDVIKKRIFAGNRSIKKSLAERYKKTSVEGCDKETNYWKAISDTIHNYRFRFESQIRMK